MARLLVSSCDMLIAHNVIIRSGIVSGPIYSWQNHLILFGQYLSVYNIRVRIWSMFDFWICGHETNTHASVSIGLLVLGRWFEAQCSTFPPWRKSFLSQYLSTSLPSLLASHLLTIPQFVVDSWWIDYSTYAASGFCQIIIALNYTYTVSGIICCVSMVKHLSMTKFWLC